MDFAIILFIFFFFLIAMVNKATEAAQAETQKRKKNKSLEEILRERGLDKKPDYSKPYSGTSQQKTKKAPAASSESPWGAAKAKPLPREEASPKPFKAPAKPKPAYAEASAASKPRRRERQTADERANAKAAESVRESSMARYQQSTRDQWGVAGADPLGPQRKALAAQLREVAELREQLEEQRDRLANQLAANWGKDPEDRRGLEPALVGDSKRERSRRSASDLSHNLTGREMIIATEIWTPRWRDL
jgi:hypothetical protein